MESKRCFVHESLYGRGIGFCIKCKRLLPYHADDCEVGKIRPSFLIKAKEAELGAIATNAIKQKPVKNYPQHIGEHIDVRPRKPGTRPRKIRDQEIKWCYTCSMKRLANRVGPHWQCNACGQIGCF